MYPSLRRHSPPPPPHQVKFTVSVLPLVAEISGGNRNVNLEDTITLSAGASFDPASESTVLAYHWRCSTPQGGCPLADGALIAPSNEEEVALEAHSLIEGVTYSFALSVAAMDGRVSEATAEVALTPPLWQFSLRGSVTSSLHLRSR